ncbi:type II toxin-antitoxin system YafQ family toxin [Chamaesiphon sp.]|uniref:type II toxin-antitoxin system RelE/ParE family toxin n=1 Tax=Chamaesiphon sp. TaxID=2814140 RepID=UPI00359472E8
MRKLISTPRFDRSLRKFTRRNSELQEKVRKTLEQMTEDVFISSLDTHKLGGNLEGIYACSYGYDCRVLFSIEPDSETEAELIILLDVGNHDDVY